MKNRLVTLSTRANIYREIDLLMGSKPNNSWRISVVEDSKKRSLPANNAYYAWIPAISDELALTIPEATRYIKRNFGLPILLADDYMGPLIGEGLQAKGYFQLSYEKQMLEMEQLPVTRLFNTKMHNRLRNDLQNYFGSLGLVLDYR